MAVTPERRGWPGRQGHDAHGPRASLRMQGPRRRRGRIVPARHPLPLHSGFASACRRAGRGAGTPRGGGRVPGLNQERRQAVWTIRGLSDNLSALFDHADAETNEPAVDLPAMTKGRQVVEDYRSVGLSLRDHPVVVRPCHAERAPDRPMRGSGREARRRPLDVAGIVLVRQRPGSARGVLFVTIEDETGHANLIVWPSVFERSGGCCCPRPCCPAAANCRRKAASST